MTDVCVVVKLARSVTEGDVESAEMIVKSRKSHLASRHLSLYRQVSSENMSVPPVTVASLKQFK